MSQAEIFLLGFIFATSITAGLFFIRFWRSTRDLLFMAFAVFFLGEALHRIAQLFSQRPNETSPWLFVIRLLTLLFILVAILQKNYSSRG